MSSSSCVKSFGSFLAAKGSLTWKWNTWGKDNNNKKPLALKMGREYHGTPSLNCGIKKQVFENVAVIFRSLILFKIRRFDHKKSFQYE